MLPVKQEELFLGSCQWQMEGANAPGTGMGEGNGDVTCPFTSPSPGGLDRSGKKLPQKQFLEQPSMPQRATLPFSEGQVALYSHVSMFQEAVSPAEAISQSNSTFL